MNKPMEFPIIKIRDKGSKRERIVGSDHHHRLLVDKNQKISFLNVQCMDGTGADGYGYEFCTTPGHWGPEIEFTDIFTLIDIYAKHLDIEEKKLGEEYQQAIDTLRAVFKKSEGIKTERDLQYEKFKERAFRDYFGDDDDTEDNEF